MDQESGAAGEDSPAAKRLRVDGNGTESAIGGSLPVSPRGARRLGAPLPADAGAEAATYWNHRPRRQVHLAAGLLRPSAAVTRCQSLIAKKGTLFLSYLWEHALDCLPAVSA